MATRKEVALQAGVSESTVTRVMNGGYVSPSVREKVAKVIEEMNYRPNLFAQGLRTKRTYQIACIVPSIDNPFYGEVMQGIEEVAIEHGYVLSMYSSRVVNKSPGRSFFSGRNDAVILLSPGESRGWLLRDLWEAHMPLATFWDWETEAPSPSVSVDLRIGMQAAVEHLVSLGHRDIGYIGYMNPARAETDRNPRLTGFKESMAAHGLRTHPDQFQYTADRGSLDAGYHGVEELVGKFPGLSAIVTSNDLLAFGAIRWLEEHGIHVPEDISVVGCDDIAYSALSNPPLTTIAIPKREVGNHLMNLVLSLIESRKSHHDGSEHIQVPIELVVRSSTAVKRTNTE